MTILDVKKVIRWFHTMNNFIFSAPGTLFLQQLLMNLDNTIKDIRRNSKLCDIRKHTTQLEVPFALSFIHACM